MFDRHVFLGRSLDPKRPPAVPGPDPVTTIIRGLPVFAIEITNPPTKIIWEQEGGLLENAPHFSLFSPYLLFPLYHLSPKTQSVDMTEDA